MESVLVYKNRFLRRGKCAIRLIGEDFLDFKE
jgi:hypothetical protein